MRVAVERYSLEDGLGERRIAFDPDRGRVEILELAPALGALPRAEVLLREQMARLANLTGRVAPAYDLACRDGRLQIMSAAPDGIRLSEVLARVVAQSQQLPGTLVYTIARELTSALAAVHREPGGLAHGLLSPEHVVLTPGGGVLLTDALPGVLVAQLGLNREHLWTDFRLLLPPSATLPSLDRRSDVAQLGASILALALARPLRADDRSHLIELVASILTDVEVSRLNQAAALRIWLHRALQLPARRIYSDALDAEPELAAVLGTVPSGRGIRQVRALVQDLVPSQGDGADIPTSALFP